MTLKSPKAISLRIALIIATLSLVSTIIIKVISDTEISGFSEFILFILVFTISYFSASYFLEKFILQRVKLIYKSINNYKSASAIQKKLTADEQNDLLTEVNKDVKAWSEDKLGRIEHLQNQENFRKEFIGNLSHELKTPVFSIQGYILTLLDGALDDPEHNEAFLKKAARSVDRITALLDDLDSINSLEEGKLPLEISKFDIVGLTKEVFELLESSAAAENITLRLKTGNQKPEFVKADKDKITQVLTNLIINSIKYGTNGGYTEVRFYDLDDNILIEVKDNGLGIEEKHLSRLFERFYRVDKSRSRHVGGTGLGLAITKHIIEAHGHEISARSVENEGSTFTFSLASGRSEN